jgi:hypothetical protein
VEHINEWARQGWRVVSVDLTPQPQFGPRTRPVLLEREIIAGRTDKSQTEPVGAWR